MSTQEVCVNCLNRKPVNLTSNRLVTESCGHVKCMECLLQEKSGCVACIGENSISRAEVTLEDRSTPIQNVIVVYSEGKEHSGNKKKKLETSHIKIETDANGRCFVCTVCKKRFHARSQVAYHAYCNGQRKPFNCPECNKSFATHSHFKYHMRVHRNERTYACEICGESYFQMSKLQRHKLKHTKEKKFACSKCNKAFNNLSSLRKHTLTHTDERPFVCPVCRRQFRDMSNFRRHVAKHDSCDATRGGRAFSCSRCPLSFHSNKDMRRHAHTHTDSKPFRCKVCNRRFRRKDNLERHIRNTHPDYVIASAVHCDEETVNAPQPVVATNQDAEKKELEKLNPLPPLPQEVIQKHLHDSESLSDSDSPDGKNVDVAKAGLNPVNNLIKIDEAKKDETDKSYIIEANNARQSVIFGPVKRDSNIDKKPDSPDCGYVHKIIKANQMANHKQIPLPPIDAKKIIELEQKNYHKTLDVGVPPKNMALYKKILYEDEAMKDGAKQHSVNPEMHWRRRMKLNIN